MKIKELPDSKWTKMQLTESLLRKSTHCRVFVGGVEFDIQKKQLREMMHSATVIVKAFPVYDNDFLAIVFKEVQS